MQDVAMVDKVAMLPYTLWRLVWAIVWLSCWFGFVYQMTLLTLKYREAPGICQVEIRVAGCGAWSTECSDHRQEKKLQNFFYTNECYLETTKNKQKQ